MQSIRSGASGSAVSDLKELLEMIAKPDKMKTALKEIESEIDRLEETSSKLVQKEQALAKAAAELNSKQSVVADQIKAVTEMQKQVSEKEAGFSHREAAVAQGEQKLSEDKAAFEQSKASMLADLDAKSYVASQLAERSAELEKKSEALIKEYEEKLGKIKAAIN